MKTRILFLISGIFWAGSLTAQVIYVDGSNITGVEDGTQNHPFNTLEEGMNAAVPGKTLLIRKGNYTPAGGIFYIKPGVKLEGESRDLTVITGDIKDTTNSSLAVKIEKLQFNDFLFWRRALINGNITETSFIKDCKCRNIAISHGGGFRDATKTEVGPIPYFNISGNEVQESVNFSFGVGLIVGENKVTNNKAGSIGLLHGSTVFTSTPPLPASGYRFENNELSGEFSFRQGSGLNLPIIVNNNKAKSLSVKSGAGHIYTLTNNTLQDGYFDTSGANRTLFSGNTIINGRISDSSGGWADGKEDAIIENNTIHYIYNKDLGGEVIRVTSASVTLKNNTITGEGGVSGISINSGVPTNIIGNKITLNNGIPVKDTYGISTSAGYGVVTGNEISGAWIGYYSKSGATLFDHNTIQKCHTGFHSMGTEEVTNNTITRCKGHGMILNGLKGPISGNNITDNDSTGIWVIKTVDIGGGGTHGDGRNILRGNGYYDLRISTVTPTADTLFINNNVWDHNTIADILKYDILNESTNTKLVISLQSIIAIPGQPVLSAPGNSAVITSSQVALAWEKITGADSCRVQMATDQNFSSLVTDTTMSSVNSLLKKNLVHNVTYFWKVKGSNLAGGGNWSETRRFSVLLTGIQIPGSIQQAWIQGYPNPFTGTTSIHYSLPVPGVVRIAMFDLSGRVLKVLVNGPQNSGEHSISLEGREIGKGLYFCRMETEGSMWVIRLISR
ncbi:MAG TPA: T9SS type A sorting domain-containing protein [Prolixibacteraceae bacterium]|nr:T9SS type A sorting domain-containing protein [Prolixibacteraceae bacterium]